MKKWSNSLGEIIKNGGNREKQEVVNLLRASIDNGLPIWEEGLEIIQNTTSGNIFFTNEDFEVAMINPDTGKLEKWYWLGYEGHEGFILDLFEEWKDGNIAHFDDIEELMDGLINEGFDKQAEEIKGFLEDEESYI